LCGKGCVPQPKGSCCIEGVLKCRDNLNVCKDECKPCPIGGKCNPDNGVNECAKDQVNCGGICQYNMKNAKCDEKQRKLICLPGFALCGKDCVQYLHCGVCAGGKFICPNDKPLCGRVCRARLQGMVCNEGLGWICPPGTILCGNSCQKAYAGAFCLQGKMVCPFGTEPCGDKCARKYEGSMCVADKQEWQCPNGLSLCGFKCQRTLEGGVCDSNIVKCNNGQVECAGKCYVQPIGSYCCPVQKKFVCRAGYRSCNNCCKRYIEGSMCVATGWQCPPGVTECGGKCVRGPQGGVCNGITGRIVCPPASPLECNGYCTKCSLASCGGCGRTCGITESCHFALGQCTCKPGRARCNGPNQPCVCILTTPQHCGGCNRPCQRGGVCVGGRCVVPMPFMPR